LKLVFRLLARLPLRANHALGALVGRLVYALSPRFRGRARDNVAASGVAPGDPGKFARANAAEIGKGATELAWALFRHEDVVRLTHAGPGWGEVQRLRSGSRPIIFVTPHLGSYDVAGRWLVSRLPILAMYRPHKLAWVDRMLREGRNAGAEGPEGNVAPATVAGVRKVLRHLKAGGCSVVLPDQVPGVGDGEWVEFFGRPAYTMTLPARLQQASGAALVFCYAERLPRGEGFQMHFAPMEDALPRDRAAAAALVNARVEELVRGCPVQYLWAYNRYKRPAGAPPAPGPA
jgi:Kdo2-lipid IVA lauroyltransferase/acyltransferase